MQRGMSIFFDIMYSCIREMDLKTLEDEVKELRQRLHEKERQLQDMSRNILHDNLSNEEIGRYSRQIIMPQIRMEGQLKLKRSSVLIVGAGGLGCPCALYLVGAGIGCIGIVDYDEVETNNLHRQLLHSENDIGKQKVQSAAETLLRLNHNVKIDTYHTQLNGENALPIIKKYDVVVDASDNAATRYLLNDACVLSQKPLVSGSALQWDGQLTVYNYNNGPCYRCIFPTPPPPESVTNCGDGGVLGAVPGIIGVLQALETVKIILNLPGVLSHRWLVFDGSDSSFHNFSLRQRNPECKICGHEPTIHELIDYELFCGAKANDKDPKLALLKEDERISWKEFLNFKERNLPYLLIDVRKETEFEICSIADSLNIPLDNLIKEKSLCEIRRIIFKKKKNDSLFSVFTVCRRGNDSQRAVEKLKNKLGDCELQIKDLIGGLHAWQREVDPSFPVY